MFISAVCYVLLFVVLILTEAEEQRIHTHGVDTKESMSHKIRSKHHRLQENTFQTPPETLRNTEEHYYCVEIVIFLNDY